MSSPETPSRWARFFGLFFPQTLFPEMELFETQEAAYESRQNAWRRLNTRKSGLVLIGILIVWLGLTVVMAIAGVLWFKPLIWATGLVWVVVAIGASGYFGGAVRRFMRIDLAAAGVPICIDCGYDMTGHADDARCPECGREHARDAEGQK